MRNDVIRIVLRQSSNSGPHRWSVKCLPSVKSGSPGRNCSRGVLNFLKIFTYPKNSAESLFQASKIALSNNIPVLDGFKHPPGFQGNAQGNTQIDFK